MLRDFGGYRGLLGVSYERRAYWVSGASSRRGSKAAGDRAQGAYERRASAVSCHCWEARANPVRSFDYEGGKSLFFKCEDFDTYDAVDHGPSVFETVNV